MKRLLCIAILVALAPVARAAEVLSFDEVLARAASAHAVPQSAKDAARALERPGPRLNLPTIRAETSASSAQNVDIFTQNVFRFDALMTLVSFDYPLADGGLRATQTQLAKLQAASFRERMREAGDTLFRETLDAAAQLYSAQERLRIVSAGLSRVVGMREHAQQLLAVNSISNVTAARWQDESLAAQSQLLDLQMQHLDAETRVKQLIGDTSPDPITIALPIDSVAVPPAAAGRDNDVTPATTLAYEQRKLAFQEAEAARRPQLTLSAFGGVAFLGDTSGIAGRQRYGLYGVRFSVALPMFDVAAQRRVAEARLETEEANIDRLRAAEQLRSETSATRLALAATAKRIALLTNAVDIAQRREESVARLASAGIRSEADVADATVERTKRESDLLAARVDLWKYAQLLGHEAGASR